MQCNTVYLTYCSRCNIDTTKTTAWSDWYLNTLKLTKPLHQHVYSKWLKNEREYLPSARWSTVYSHCNGVRWSLKGSCVTLKSVLARCSSSVNRLQYGDYPSTVSGGCIFSWCPVQCLCSESVCNTVYYTSGQTNWLIEWLIDWLLNIILVSVLRKSRGVVRRYAGSSNAVPKLSGLRYCFFV